MVGPSPSVTHDKYTVPMKSVAYCIALSIYRYIEVLDIVPSVLTMPIEAVEDSVDVFISSLHDDIERAIIQEGGEFFIQSKDPAGLASFIHSRVFRLQHCKGSTLLKMAQLIINAYHTKGPPPALENEYGIFYLLHIDL